MSPASQNMLMRSQNATTNTTEKLIEFLYYKDMYRCKLIYILHRVYATQISYQIILKPHVSVVKGSYVHKRSVARKNVFLPNQQDIFFKSTYKRYYNMDIYVKPLVRGYAAPLLPNSKTHYLDLHELKIKLAKTNGSFHKPNHKIRTILIQNELSSDLESLGQELFQFIL